MCAEKSCRFHSNAPRPQHGHTVCKKISIDKRARLSCQTLAYDMTIATTCTATLSTRKDEYTSTNRLGLRRARLSTVDHAAHTATHTPRRPNDRPALRSPPTDTASVLRGRLERRCGSPCARKSPGAHTTSAGQGQQRENAKHGHGLSRAARWQLHPNRTGTREYACGSLGRPRHRRHAMREQCGSRAASARSREHR